MTQPPPPSTQKDDSTVIKVMLVDDSAVIRGLLTRILNTHPDVEIIKTVSDGEQALSALKTYKPDVIFLDVEMPNMDGMTALPQILKLAPQAKVIMCSTLTVRNAKITLDALRAGATDCLAKPTTPSEIQVGGDFHNSIMNLMEGLRPRRKAVIATEQPAEPPKIHQSAHTYTGRPELLAIGSSTGGPQALFEVLSHLKDINIPVIITQHMPATFTKILAQHISNHTGVTALEGEAGMLIEKGVVYIAPGGFHMLLKKNAQGQAVIHLDNGPAINFCKPAVDPMLDSALAIYGNKILAAILTGMGHDGLEAAKKLVNVGGRLIAQDKQTSVVWGMPGAVAEAGICSSILPLKDIGPFLHKAVSGQ